MRGSCFIAKRNDTCVRLTMYNITSNFLSLSVMTILLTTAVTHQLIASQYVEVVPPCPSTAKAREVIRPAPIDVSCLHLTFTDGQSSLFNPIT